MFINEMTLLETKLKELPAQTDRMVSEQQLMSLIFNRTVL